MDLMSIRLYLHFIKFKTTTRHKEEENILRSKSNSEFMLRSEVYSRTEQIRKKTIEIQLEAPILTRVANHA